MTIIEALADKNLLGALPAFQDLSTWGSWLVFLRAIYGLAIEDDELEIFKRHTGRTFPLTTRKQKNGREYKRRMYFCSSARDQQEPPKKIVTTIARLKTEAANLIRLVASGGKSSLVLDELHDVEAKIAAAEAQLATVSNMPTTLLPKAHRRWLLAKLERLQGVLATDPYGPRWRSLATSTAT
jgi:hypothetical protein